MRCEIVRKIAEGAPAWKHWQVNHKGDFSNKFRSEHKTAPLRTPWVAGIIDKRGCCEGHLLIRCSVRTSVTGDWGFHRKATGAGYVCGGQYRWDLST
eukprot:2041579-Pyramimonas_sp.AAC.3